VIQDSRLISIGGKLFPLPAHGELDEQGWFRGSVTLRFRAAFSTGRFHISVRLQEGNSGRTFHLIEKQIGLLAFDMLDTDMQFLGIVDLGFEESIEERSSLRQP
jgi:hypothetical protein